MLLALPDSVDVVELRAGFVSDATVQKAGWVLDDLALWGLLPPAAPWLRLEWLSGELVLSWQAVPGANGYRVESATGLDGGSWVPLGVTTDTVWTLDAPPPDGAARFRLVALGAPERLSRN